MVVSQMIGDAVAAVLLDLPDQVVKTVANTLKTLGAVTTEDITEEELLPLKPIQARRLVAIWAQRSKCKSFPSQHSTILL